MKYRVLIISILLIISVSRNIGFCQHTRQLLYEGIFDYALIEDAHLYIPHRSIILERSDFIKKMRLDNDSIDIIHYCSGSINVKLPYIWTKSERELYVAYFMHYKNKAPALIDYRPFETLDTIQLKQSEEQWIKECTISLTPLNDYNWSLAIHRPKYLSDSTREAYINTLSFDISVKDDSLTFYLTDEDAFYIWDCKIPPKGERYAEWNQVAAYTSHYFQEEFIPRDESKSYNKQKEIRNAIKDTLFFDGHFKVIVQNREKYIINRKHGNIYHLGKKGIKCIGKIQKTDIYPKIQNKSLFIEDRDQNRLIFFAPVEWKDTYLPKPNVYYMKEDEMREYFKYVMD